MEATSICTINVVKSDWAFLRWWVALADIYAYCNRRNFGLRCNFVSKTLYFSLKVRNLVANQTMRAHTFMWQRHCCTKIYCAWNSVNARVRNFYSYDNFCNNSTYLLVLFLYVSNIIKFLLYLTYQFRHTKKCFQWNFVKHRYLLWVYNTAWCSEIGSLTSLDAPVKSNLDHIFLATWWL